MEANDRLELFFSQSLDGFFFMMIDEPVVWDDSIDKEKALDYVFEHQRVTKVNDAMLAQYGATREEFLGTTPADLFRARPGVRPADLAQVLRSRPAAHRNRRAPG